MNFIEDYQFKNPSLFEQAMTHKSWVSESGIHNEKLEFLGDAVLNLAISDLLMEAYPSLTEGDLTKLRAGLVSGQTLGELAEQLGFHTHLRVGKGLSPKNQRFLAEVLEAYLGALYLDSHFEKTKQTIQKIFNEKIKNKDFSTDYKSYLQEWCQKKHKTNPHYKIKKVTGLEHQKIFFMEVWIETKCLGSGSDPRKKQAEQQAAKSACEHLNILNSFEQEN